jgi:hypothetical protein
MPVAIDIGAGALCTLRQQREAWLHAAVPLLSHFVGGDHDVEGVWIAGEVLD